MVLQEKGLCLQKLLAARGRAAPCGQSLLPVFGRERARKAVRARFPFLSSPSLLVDVFAASSPAGRGQGHRCWGLDSPEAER